MGLRIIKGIYSMDRCIFSKLSAHDCIPSWVVCLKSDHLGRISLHSTLVSKIMVKSLVITIINLSNIVFNLEWFLNNVGLIVIFLINIFLLFLWAIGVIRYSLIQLMKKFSVFNELRLCKIILIVINKVKFSTFNLFEVNISVLVVRTRESHLDLIL
jgi:hypothetical protein